MKGIFGYDSPIMGALTSIGDCICLSVLWVVFSLPVVTIGASTTALYYAAYHSVRKKEGGLWRLYWGAFTENFKRSTLVAIPVIAAIALLTVDVFVLRGMRAAGNSFGTLFYVVLALWCLSLTWGIYAAGYAARFNGTVKDVLKFSLMLMTIHPIKMLCVLAPMLFGIAITLMVPYMALIVPAAVFVVASFSIERVFRLHMRPEDLERETEPVEEDELEEDDDFHDQ